MSLDKEKADNLSILFATVGEKLASDNTPDELGAGAIPDHSQQQRIEDFPISEQKIKEMIGRKVKSNKPGGHDNVSSKDLKLFGDFATEELFEVMNRCKEQSKFPPVWKTSKVKTIFKSGETLERGNYRPISLLGIPSKTLEANICESFDEH